MIVAYDNGQSIRVVLYNVSALPSYCRNIRGSITTIRLRLYVLALEGYPVHLC